MWQKSAVSFSRWLRWNHVFPITMPKGQFPHWQNESLFFFKKWISFFNFEIIYFSIIYYNIVIWVVKLFRM
jgi:hypothetical protein